MFCPRTNQVAVQFNGWAAVLQALCAAAWAVCRCSIAGPQTQLLKQYCYSLGAWAYLGKKVHWQATAALRYRGRLSMTGSVLSARVVWVAALWKWQVAIM